MSINDKYSIDGNSRHLQEQYQGFGKSTLTEMLTLPVEDYELITPDTKIEDIRELKKAEREGREEEQSQIEGQESIMSLMPDAVPEEEKQKKEEVTITDVLRELFKPREMKEQLDSLVNMDPDSSEMQWWVGDFNQSGNRTYKKMPFFLFFYSLTEGMKIKNMKTGEITTYTYKDFYFMVRAAFGQETVRGTDVWNQAFGEEYEAEQQAKKEEEQRKREEEKRKKEIQKQREEKQRAIKENQEKTTSKEPEKEVSEQNEGENAAALNKISENSDSDNNLKNCNCEDDSKEDDATEETETPEVVTGEVEENSEMISQKEENPVCDIAHSSNGYTITLPAEIGQRMYMVHEPYQDIKAYISYIYPYLYEIRSEKNIKMYYRDEQDNSHEIGVQQMESLMIYTDEEEAKKEKAKLNGEE